METSRIVKISPQFTAESNVALAEQIRSARTEDGLTLAVIGEERRVPRQRAVR